MLVELEVAPPTAFGVATYPAGATFGPRQMREWEFVWIIEGDVVYRWGSDQINAPPGSIVLCRPGATDVFHWDPQRRTRHAYFHFDVVRLPDPWRTLDPWPLVRVPPPDDVLRPLFRHVLRWAGRGDALQARLAIATMLAAFVSGEIAAGDVPPDVLPELVERVLRHIHVRLEDDPAHPIDLPELAAVAAVTPEHLIRVFKAATGLTPAETVRMARLDRAAVLLARSNYTVSEIAAICGFASPFHFSRRFKAAFGAAPSELRVAIAAGATPPTPLLLRVQR